MSWTEQDERTASAKLVEYEAAFALAYAGWQNAIQSGQAVGTAKAQVDSILTEWRRYVEQLRARSDSIVANEGVMNTLAAKMLEVNQQKELLAQLRAEAVTRDDQAASVNPKTRQTPFTNLLGLRRIFRESTRTTIFYLSVVFSVLAIALLGYFVYVVRSAGAITEAAYNPGLQGQSGGRTV